MRCTPVCCMIGARARAPRQEFFCRFLVKVNHSVAWIWERTDETLNEYTSFVRMQFAHFKNDEKKRRKLSGTYSAFSSLLSHIGRWCAARPSDVSRYPEAITKFDEHQMNKQLIDMLLSSLPPAAARRFFCVHKIETHLFVANFVTQVFVSQFAPQFSWSDTCSV